MKTQLIEYAEELGLDTDRFAQELEDEVYREKILSDYEDYSQYGRMATPTYVVNNIFYPTQQLGLHPLLIDAFIRLMLLAPDQYTQVPPQVIDPDKEYIATIRTNKGDIVVELFADQAPVNVNSFVFLARDGWYDGQTFFYVEPDLVAYYCGDEISSDLTFDEAGMVALFTPMPGHNSSQFFITYAPLPDLNGDVAESLTPTQPGPDQPPADVIETILIEER